MARHRFLLATLVAAMLFPAPPTVAADDERPFMRGMVVSCPRAGQIWGTPEMAESLDQLDSLGVQWVAVHPYAWVKEDGSVRFEPAATLPFLGKSVDLAERAGIRMFWKPHLGYWGSFPYRGAIDFGESPTHWARFFREYEDFIVDQAKFAEAASVDLFAVGVELEGTAHYEDLWRRIIARVRDVYSGRIVYAANWDRLDDVPFWDAVDLLGVHAYFPLSQTDDPDRNSLYRGWDGPLAELEHLSRSIGKPVLVAEIGYNTSTDAARTPWAYESVHSEAARSLRGRLIDVAIERLEDTDFITGMFWWKWMPGNGRRRNFSMRDAEARVVLRRHWAPLPQRTTAR